MVSVPSSLQVSKLPKELRSVHQLCFSSDSSKLFASSCQSSVIVVAVSQQECRYLHTLKHKTGEWKARSTTHRSQTKRKDKTVP